MRSALADLRGALADALGSALVEVRLFGSYARGEQHDESDVDVFILLSQEADAEQLDTIFAEVTRVNVAHRVWVSPLIMGRSRFLRMLAEERRVAEDIQSEGMPV